ncbi:acyl-CoA dehydrogenase family protein [Sphingopyxis sp.]|jgi:acyl-CoA dehydrogenase|uniref:acyl-CoA dehydrogenase family protein n=1 Tax=Sphingopyxis sp. TaxID=1908224 RepID=UPI002E01FA13|nr:acyl-CoA dehydrogenase family protein [Sphingopyxis sp.]
MEFKMQRDIFGPEHDAYRVQVRRFVEKEIEPNCLEWDQAGQVPRELWLKAGTAGLLCPGISAEHGGGGGDRMHSAIVMEEVAGAGYFGPGFGLHSDIVAPYLEAYGTAEQKAQFLPAMASGAVIGAIAMTEPGGGSDLKALTTRAECRGDSFVLRGQKTFITNGVMADLILVAAKTEADAGAHGISLFLVEGNSAGLSRGKPLRKLGMHAQDTAELFFDEVVVGREMLLGTLHGGFQLMMKELAWERLQIAIMGAALLENALQWTIDFASARSAFGQRLIDFQNSRFKLAEAKTQILVARVFVDKCISLANEGILDSATSAAAKLWVSEIQSKILDELLQLHGGYGYMWDYPICRAFADTRVHRIFGGPNEVMKEIIARSLR